MEKINYHISLAFYFSAQPLFFDGDLQKKPHIRKCVELPFQQTKGGLWDNLTETLSDLDFIHAKYFCKMHISLIDEYTSSILSIRQCPEFNNLLPENNNLKENIVLLEEFLSFIKRSDFVFKRNSTLVHQEALEEDVNSYPYKKASLYWKSNNLKSCIIYRSRFDNSRSVQLFNYRIDNEVASCSYYIDECEQLAIGTESGVLILMNLKNGEQIFKLQVNKSRIACLSYYKEGLILCGTNDGKLLSIIRTDGTITGSIQIHNSSIISIINLSSEVITCSLDKRINLCQVRQSKISFIGTIYQSVTGLSAISYISNLELLLIGSSEGEIIALTRKNNWQKVIQTRISYESITDFYSFGNRGLLVSCLNGNLELFEIDSFQNCIKINTLRFKAPIKRIIKYQDEFGILIQLGKTILHLIKNQIFDLKFENEILNSYYKSEHLLTIDKMGKITMCKLVSNPGNSKVDYECEFCDFIEDRNLIFCIKPKQQRKGEILIDEQTTITIINEETLSSLSKKTFDLHPSGIFFIKNQNILLLSSHEKVGVLDIIENRLIKTIDTGFPPVEVIEFEKLNIIIILQAVDTSHAKYGKINAWSLENFQTTWKNSVEFYFDETTVNNYFLDDLKGIFYIKGKFDGWKAIDIRNGELIEDKRYIPPQGFEILSNGELNTFEGDEWKSKQSISLGAGKIIRYWIVEKDILFVQKNNGDVSKIDIKNLTCTRILNNLKSFTNPVFFGKKILYISKFNWLEIYDLDTDTCEPQKYLTGSAKNIKYNQRNKTIAIINDYDRLEILKMLN